MKKFMCITFAFGLLFGCVGVTSADTGAKKVPKIEKSYSIDLASIGFTYEVMPVELHNGAVPMFIGTGMLTVPIVIPTGAVGYLSNKKTIYHQPDIDRKWVWWNSIITNS